MLLEESGGICRIEPVLDYSLDRLGLVLTPSHQDDSLGTHYGADTHSDSRLRGHCDIASEIPGLSFSGFVRQGNRACPAVFRSAGLIESQLSAFSYAYDQKVKPSGHLVEFGAIFRYDLPGNGPVRNVHILRLDIHHVEEYLVEPVVPVLQGIFLTGIVLIDGEHFHVLERHHSLAMLLREECEQ